MPDQLYHTAASMERLTGIKAATWLRWSVSGKVRSHLMGARVMFRLDEVAQERLPRAVKDDGEWQSHPMLLSRLDGRPRKYRRGKKAARG